MPIRISKQKAFFVIDDDKKINFQELQAAILSHFGFIRNLSQKITYKYNNAKSFIVDDATLQQAKAAFPNELLLNIELNLQKSQNKNAAKRFIKSKDQNLTEEDWCEYVIPKLKNQKNIQDEKPYQYYFDQIDQKFYYDIKTQEKKTERLGHPQDLVGSFLLSYYQSKSGQNKAAPDEIDKSIWRLQQWRHQKRKQLAKQSPTSKNIVPALKKPDDSKFKLDNRNSYIFPNNPVNNNKIVDPNQEQLAKIKPISVDQHEKIKYYLLDQTYHKLSDFQQKRIEKNSLLNLLSQFRQYSDNDMNFATDVVQAFLKYSGGDNVYYPPTNQNSGVLKEFQDNEIVAILGDWGTGELDAFQLLEQVVRNQKATIVLHNGDVYYAGFPHQYKRLSDKINQLQQQFPNLRFYTIPGNHDYYTFGGPFYDHLKDNHKRKEFNQQFGFFCLRNKSHTVQFIGLNTGKNEHSIKAPIDIKFEGTFIEQVQVQWAIKKIKQFPGKSILLTHHQLFSSFQAILGTYSQFGVKNPQINCKLSAQLFQIFPKLTCWIWGHQHRFSTYIENSYGINRCILAGNSAFQNNQQNYYKVLYPADDITINKFHPQQDQQQYYHHTAIILHSFNQPYIKAKYVYMTSSFRKPAIKTREQQDKIYQPSQLDVYYCSTFQIIEQSGLSISSSNYGICLDSEPANLQFVDPSNRHRKERLEANKEILIRNQNTGDYLYFKNDSIAQGDYFTEQKSQQQKYLWKLTTMKPQISTGDIFRLYNISKKSSVQKYIDEDGVVKLKIGQNSSKFFIYKRKTKHIDLPDPKLPGWCCNIM